jgi:sulfane dehydrogenase subunit SoxC
MEESSENNKLFTAPKISRRLLLGGAATAAVVLVQTSVGKMVQAAVPQSMAAGLLPDSASSKAREPLTDPAKIPGRGPSVSGTPSSFENPERLPSLTSSRTPLQDLYGTITPSALHFERHHGGIPVIDPQKYELLIHGMVDKPLVFSLADLKRFPSVTRTCFIECSGNFRSGKQEMTPQEICGLTSQSEWTGVMLSTLFREVGIREKATWFLAEGGDAAVMTRSIPVGKGWDDAMIVYAQNGEAVRPEQGYPARLLLPGWEGNTSVKWLRRIELSDAPFMTREETSKYTETVKDGKIRQFSFVMDARSIITFPSFPVQLERGWVEIRGIAWTGRGKIVKVEVSVNGGRSWMPAELQGPVLDKAHTAFRYLWNWTGGETEIMSRAVDETGYVQPSYHDLSAARESKGGYHFNPITCWRVQRSGKVTLGEFA